MSRSQSLYPALVLLLNTGLRVSELRLLQWRHVDLLDCTLVVGRSKTRGGEGRIIPLNLDASAALIKWHGQFSPRQPEHYVFPTERYGLDGEAGFLNGAVAVWNRDPKMPIGSWKVAWSACRKAAAIQCRLHDLRHTLFLGLGRQRSPMPHSLLSQAG